MCRRYWRTRPRRCRIKTHAAVPATPQASQSYTLAYRQSSSLRKKRRDKGGGGATVLPAGVDGDGGCRVVPGGGRRQAAAKVDDVGYLSVSRTSHRAAARQAYGVAALDLLGRPRQCVGWQGTPARTCAGHGHGGNRSGGVKQNGGACRNLQAPAGPASCSGLVRTAVCPVSPSPYVRIFMDGR